MDVLVEFKITSLKLPKYSVPCSDANFYFNLSQAHQLPSYNQMWDVKYVNICINYVIQVNVQL